MSAFRLIAPLILVSLLANGASAGIRPSFNLDRSAWDASHIVLVTEGDKIDGVVQVLETWKGDLKQGDRITVPDLAAFAPEKERIVSKSINDRLKEINDRLKEMDQEKKKLPASVTCSRMVLFLIRKVENEKTTWLPVASWGGMKLSIAWIESDDTFAFAQEINPGAEKLLSYGMNECELKCRVEDVLLIQNKLMAIMRQDDEAKMTAGIPSLLKTNSYSVRSSVISELGSAGKKGLPAIRNILKDDSMSHHHYDALFALANAGGTAVGPELTAILKEELAFWKKAGPDLEKGWWGRAQDEDPKSPRNHYSRTYNILCVLNKLHFDGSKDTVIEFRKYWRSLPQLSGDRGDDQLTEACDAILEALEKTRK